jgi:predicted nucleotidyltransferase
VELFNPEHRQFIQLLNEFEVEYCLLGGYAVNLYGYHRTTGDMDVFINPTNENKTRMVNALQAFGYDTAELENADFKEALYFFVGEFPFRIDILNSTVGIEFSMILHRIRKVQYDDLEFNLIALEDLILNKEALNTYKDLNDAEKLKAISAKLKKP